MQQILNDTEMPSTQKHHGDGCSVSPRPADDSSPNSKKPICPDLRSALKHGNGDRMVIAPRGMERWCQGVTMRLEELAGKLDGERCWYSSVSMVKRTARDIPIKRPEADRGWQRREA